MTARKDYKKPLPHLDEENRWFWEACARHELVLQKCASCKTPRFYPRAVCPECASSQTEYVRASGRGTIYTFTVTHQNQAPGFRDELPYVMAYVELDEGPRILTNIINTAPDAVRIGLPVEVVFEDIDEALAIPKFQRAP
ncbi:MAG TPA: Zn-ribbon domain-containing OB-fold protein [Candidatus Binatia bacterium]|nr:Zn-ribbon domain-containing OB-fold protein [Candidatus Binatia bacterium]